MLRAYGLIPPIACLLPLFLAAKVENRWNWKLNHMFWKAAAASATLYLFLYIIYATLISSYFLFLPYFLVSVILFFLLLCQRAQEHFISSTGGF